MHHHYSGEEALKVAPYVVVIMGTLNLLAMKFQKRSNLAASWANLFGLS